ncbi:MAG: hypothetical protein JSW17_03380 [Candidatus Omnitrophota bacterium]|nr:MAG: hypothetical protein JSW17_03380 [Candidatus Omnitrophota bacterium]
MSNRMRTITLVVATVMFVFTTSCYLFKSKGEARNYVVLTTDDWTFTEYVLPNDDQLKIFVSQVNKFYDQQEDVDFYGAFQEYLSLRKLSRYGSAVKRVNLKEAPSMFNMPRDSLLTIVSEGEIVYRKDIYDRIMAEFEKKKMQQTW